MKYILENEETSRLAFRLLKEDDFEDWMPLFKDTSAALYLGMDTSLSPKEQCQFWFNKVFNRYANDLGGMNVLIDKESNRLVGQCGLLVQTVAEQKKLEVGYSVLPEFRGMGYAIEAAQKCRNYAFEHRFTPDLISIIHIDNIASKKVALKNGMQVVLKLDDFEGMPTNIFGINRESWQQLMKKR